LKVIVVIGPSLLTRKFSVIGTAPVARRAYDS
jgi:hypothetical protein